jgi:hypothetical protein
VYQCFCKKEIESAEDICSDYHSDQLKGLALAQAVSFLIIGANFVLRGINIILIKFIGYYTES